MVSKVEEALSGAMSAVFEYHPEAPNEDTVRDALDTLIAAVREEEREASKYGERTARCFCGRDSMVFTRTRL